MILFKNLRSTGDAIHDGVNMLLKNSITCQNSLYAVTAFIIGSTSKSGHLYTSFFFSTKTTQIVGQPGWCGGRQVFSEEKQKKNGKCPSKLFGINTYIFVQQVY